RHKYRIGTFYPVSLVGQRPQRVTGRPTGWRTPVICSAVRSSVAQISYIFRINSFVMAVHIEDDRQTNCDRSCSQYDCEQCKDLPTVMDLVVFAKGYKIQDGRIDH